MIKNFIGYLHKTLSEKEIEKMHKNSEVVYQKPLEKEKKEKHYHYLIGYNFKLSTGDFGFGDIKTTTLIKIRHIDIEKLRVLVLERARENNKEIVSVIILAISPLECGCEDS